MLVRQVLDGSGDDGGGGDDDSGGDDDGGPRWWRYWKGKIRRERRMPLME